MMQSEKKGERGEEKGKKEYAIFCFYIDEFEWQKNYSHRIVKET